MFMPPCSWEKDFYVVVKGPRCLVMYESTCPHLGLAKVFPNHFKIKNVSKNLTANQGVASCFLLAMEFIIKNVAASAPMITMSTIQPSEPFFA